MANALFRGSDGRPANALVALRRRQAAQRISEPPRISLADVGELGAEALTPYGNYVSARDAVEDFQAGHPGSGAMNALLALPGLGIVGAVGRRGRKVIGATKKQIEAAQKNATEMLGLPENNTLADRAQALARVDDPLWRGGNPPSEAGEMGNQHWFSRDKGTAEGHAKKPGNELRRYVMLNSAERFRADSFAPLRQDHATGIAAALHKDGYEKLAKDFVQAGADGDLPLSHAAYILKSRTGEPGMRKYLGAIGFDAIDDGKDIAVTGWGKGVMRDPERAAFDPARLGDPSIYAGIAGLGALPLLTRERSGEEY